VIGEKRENQRKTPSSHKKGIDRGTTSYRAVRLQVGIRHSKNGPKGKAEQIEG